ncbi:Membrane proteinase PrsW, cleaves anti-sigma factor RsiW, M82 family [Cryobacterium psychrotolerans]|uniref:Membrane proteinase PrsW, cleaves anti-sigma factor RsiW, M82 family n=1 Tax=Cryobacterium psychrotolerans TaxID=386301 RepID=A0A1G9EDL3_9MICO|nr:MULTISPECIES: PrsW family intramembrane metalloprotease [Cryobacterium]TFD46455.1 PrsW family intramembrane metalloprotease [Cryobacterium sp. TMT1-2-1]TFD88421.1 PrsW family intramembrane metalloprotease [Cryobacterium psychrotolerans]SDK74163.1 Membrane proteinase PrsW, cleaves anti-sigma factor RsiW, M82 family [Cryobacterium psychrotolerans]
MTFDQSPVQPSPEPVQPVWTPPKAPSRAGTLALAVTGITLAALALLLVFVYLASFLGTSGLLVSLLLALIPLTAVLFAVRWIDRWDPEPRPALWFAFLWGAGVSVVTALIFDLGVQLTIRASGGELVGNDLVTGVVQAPIVEEAAKGFGVLLIFWAIRRHFDGPVDGIVYAATIAAGFAFSENIQYFGTAMADGGPGVLGVTFLLRGVFSPFAHVMFTACTGLALGIAARRTGAFGAIGYFVIGLIPAVLLHALWNGASLVFVGDSALLRYYVFVQVPLFIGAILVVNLMRRQERQVTQARLNEYSAAGWFTPEEVAMLATAAGRRQALAWATAQPPGRQAAMRGFITDATRLAFARERMLNAGAGARPADRSGEARLLASLRANRAVVIGTPPAARRD